MTASWIIISLEDGRVICETFNSKFKDAINKEKFKAVPIMEHLQSLNKKG